METKDKWFALLALLCTSAGQGLDNVTTKVWWVEWLAGTCAALGLGLALFAKMPGKRRKPVALPLPPEPK